jgi:hypothetical protein
MQSGISKQGICIHTANNALLTELLAFLPNKVPKMKAYLSPLFMKFGSEFHYAQIVIFWVVTPCSVAQCIPF